MESVSIKDYFLYLFGNEQAIKKLAFSHNSLYLGAFFVLIAGIAREYDQENLLEVPGIFLIPFPASIVMCFLLYLFSWAYFRKSINPNGLGHFRIFLAVFWLTAPCAWVYAIPVESLFDSLTALKINLWLLFIVALWRVLLFTRVIKVLTGVNIILAIITLACPVIFISTFFSQLSLLGIMSGGNHSEEQLVLMNANSSVGGIAFFIFLPILLLYISQAKGTKKFKSFETLQNRKTTLAVKLSCLGIFIGSLLILIKPQQQMRNYSHFFSLVNSEKYHEAHKYIRNMDRNKFPASKQIYPVLRYYGLVDSINLFVLMDGTEKEWYQKDIKRWVERGIKGRHFETGLAEVLPKYSYGDYHISFFREHKEELADKFYFLQKDELENLDHFIKLIGIELPKEE
ncbi:MAG: hypothetical protein NE328_16170 [Lentisphaeraceae bacterium]|nr:hypothetical protein [Lentisphaeraceae bacterium]